MFFEGTLSKQFIKLYYSIIDALEDDPLALLIYIFISKNAYPTNRVIDGIELKSFQVLTTSTELVKKTKSKPNDVKNRILKLERLGIILKKSIRKGSTRCLIITNLYAAIEVRKNQSSFNPHSILNEIVNVYNYYGINIKKTEINPHSILIQSYYIDILDINKELYTSTGSNLKQSVKNTKTQTLPLGGERSEKANGVSENQLAARPTQRTINPLDVWDRLATKHDLAKPRKINQARMKKINSVANQFKLDEWKEIESNFNSSKFLTTKSQDQTWRPTLDWFIKPSSLTKILEGNYNEKTKGIKIEWIREKD